MNTKKLLILSLMMGFGTANASMQRNTAQLQGEQIPTTRRSIDQEAAHQVGGLLAKINNSLGQLKIGNSISAEYRNLFNIGSVSKQLEAEKKAKSSRTEQINMLNLLIEQLMTGKKVELKENTDAITKMFSEVSDSEVGTTYHMAVVSSAVEAMSGAAVKYMAAMEQRIKQMEEDIGTQNLKMTEMEEYIGIQNIAVGSLEAELKAAQGRFMSYSSGKDKILRKAEKNEKKAKDIQLIMEESKRKGNALPVISPEFNPLEEEVNSTSAVANGTAATEVQPPAQEPKQPPAQQPNNQPPAPKKEEEPNAQPPKTPAEQAIDAMYKQLESNIGQFNFGTPIDVMGESKKSLRFTLDKDNNTFKGTLIDSSDEQNVATTELSLQELAPFKSNTKIQQLLTAALAK